MKKRWLFSYGYIYINGENIHNKKKVTRDIKFFVKKRSEAFRIAFSILLSVIKEQEKDIVFYRVTLRHGDLYYDEVEAYKLKSKFFKTNELLNISPAQLAECFQKN